LIHISHPVKCLCLQVLATRCLNGYRSLHQNYLLPRKGQAEVKHREKNITILDWMVWTSDAAISRTPDHQFLWRVHELPDWPIVKTTWNDFFSFQNTEIVCMLRHFNKLGTCMMSICGLWILDKWRLFLFRVKHILSVRKKKEYRCKLHQ